MTFSVAGLGLQERLALKSAVTFMVRIIFLSLHFNFLLIIVWKGRICRAELWGWKISKGDWKLDDDLWIGDNERIVIGKKQIMIFNIIII